jgi:hypothetical protein
MITSVLTQVGASGLSPFSVLTRSQEWAAGTGSESPLTCDFGQAAPTDSVSYSGLHWLACAHLRPVTPSVPESSRPGRDIVRAGEP